MRCLSEVKHMAVAKISNLQAHGNPTQNMQIQKNTAISLFYWFTSMFKVAGNNWSNKNGY